MRRGRGAGLAGLAALLLVAAGRAQVQQEPSAETTEGTAISINCSHPNKKSYDYIQWYRQLPGRGPAFLVSSVRESKDLPHALGRLWVAADGRSSALRLDRPRRGDAAVYYCALGDTGRGAGAAAGQEPRRAGPGVCVGAGGTAPGGPGRGRCRSARRGRLAPPGPARPRALGRFPRTTGTGILQPPQAPQPREVPPTRLRSPPPGRNLLSPLTRQRPSCPRAAGHTSVLPHGTAAATAPRAGPEDVFHATFVPSSRRTEKPN